MENYIDLLRNILKNFKYSNEFDDIIKRILDKIFNNYYFIKKKYRISKKEDLIFRFNRYNKKLLKENNIVNDLLTEEIKNYKQYIEDSNINQEDFKIILNKRICFYPPCLNKIIGTYNYCYLHNKDSV